MMWTRQRPTPQLGLASQFLFVGRNTRSHGVTAAAQRTVPIRQSDQFRRHITMIHVGTDIAVHIGRPLTKKKSKDRVCVVNVHSARLVARCQVVDVVSLARSLTIRPWKSAERECAQCVKMFLKGRKREKMRVEVGVSAHLPFALSLFDWRFEEKKKCCTH